MATTCLRILISIINIIYAAIAAALTYIVYLFSIEVKLLKDSRNFEKYQLDYDIYWPQIIPWIFGFAALISIFAAVIGLLGAGINNKGVIYTYIALAVIAIIASVGAGVTATKKTEEMGKQINDTMLDVFTHSFDKKEIRQEFERIEKLLRCCGARNQNEYAGKGLPKSCCDDDEKEPQFTKRNGCMVVAADYGSWAVFWCGTVVCGITSILCLVSIILSVFLVLCKNEDGSGMTHSLKFSCDKKGEATC